MNDKQTIKENKKIAKMFNFIGVFNKENNITGTLLYNLLILSNKKTVYIKDNKILYNDKCETLYNFNIYLFNKLLHLFNDAKIEYIVYEFSFLDDDILKSINFKGLILEEDDYLKSLIKLIKKLNGKIVINSEGSYTKIIKKKTNKYLTVGKNADYNITTCNYYHNKSLITLEYLYNTFNITIPFLGIKDIYDYVKALALLNSLEFDLLEIITITPNLNKIAGHNQIITTNKGTIILNDSDNLKEIINSLNLKTNIHYFLITDASKDANQLANYKNITFIKDNNWIMPIKKSIKNLKKNEYLFLIGNINNINKAIQIKRKN